MALLARRKDVGLRQVRSRIRRRQHIVMPVAVVTGRHIGGDVWLAEGHRFAVIGFPVILQPVLMAFAATLVARHFEMPVLWRFNFVRRVTIGAYRPAAVAFREQLTMHTLVIDFLDLHMAYAAGFCDVCVIDRRIAVDSALDIVRPVAITARWRHDQAHLQQCASMDAFHVLRRRLRILHLILSSQPGIAVTLRARLRKIQFIYR